MPSTTTPPKSELPNDHKQLRTTRPPLRVVGWGGMAMIALGVISQTDTGSERLQHAIAFVSGTGGSVVAQIPPRDLALEAENRRLAAELREMTSEREQLTGRIAVLERSVQDMTGSIKKQTEQLEAARAATSPVAPPQPTPPATTPAATVATITPDAVPGVPLGPLDLAEIKPWPVSSAMPEKPKEPSSPRSSSRTGAIGKGRGRASD